MEDNYAAFAVLYDEAISTDNEARITMLQQAINKHQPQAKTILELGCGTGTILAAFADNYAVTGLDLSPQMLKMAARKVPSAELVQGNMAEFDLGRQFDVILCVFDSINHLLDFADWRRTFEQAAVHLSPNGLFIFDVNTRTKLENRVAQPLFSQQVRGFQVGAQMEQVGHSIFEWHIVVDKPTDPDFTTKHFTVPETAFALEKIEQAAAEYFSIKEKLTDDGSSVSEAAERIYFICQKA